MRKFLLIAALAGLMQSAYAQKWVSQAKNAVFSIVTYDKDGNILNNGNGFFIGADGVALSDYKIFKDAYKANIIDVDGQKSEVSYILGANDIYDVVKFKVNTSKKISPLTLASGKATSGQTLYVLPYSTQKTVTPVKGAITAASDIAESYKFYTLGVAIDDKNMSCPVLNEAGQVVGLVQKGDDKECYALDSQYGSNLSISAISGSDYTLASIGIDKDLPENAQDALVYLMMNNNNEKLINRMIEKFPNEADGYLRRATNSLDKKEFESAEADLNTYLDKSQDKVEAHYQISKLLYNLKIYMPDASYKDWDYDKALSEIDQALSVSPQAVYTRLKADIYFAKEDYNSALSEYNKLIGTELNAAEIYICMADCKERLQSSDEEIMECYDKAVEQYTKPYSNDAAPYLYARAQRKASTGKYRDAVNDYNDVEHIFGGRASAEFYYNRSIAEKNGKMYQQAQQDIKEALELAPENEEILLEYAGLHIMLKDYETSKLAAERAIQLYPEEPLGYRYLGYSQAMMGNKTEGKANLEKAKQMGDDNAQNIIDKYCK